MGSLKTISIYDGWQCVYQIVTGSGTDTTKSYTFANYIDEPVTMVRKWNTSTDTTYYLQGNNYNIEALTDRTGSVIERYEYTPYGKMTVYTGAGTDGQWFTSDDVSATVSAKGNALTFQGRELDGETRNLYFRNRHYQPTLGRFFSRDPMRLGSGDLNHFRMEFGKIFQGLDPIGWCTLINDWHRVGYWPAFLASSHLETQWQQISQPDDPVHLTPAFLGFGLNPSTMDFICGCAWRKKGVNKIDLYQQQEKLERTYKCCDKGCDKTCYSRSEYGYGRTRVAYSDVSSVPALFSPQISTTIGVFGGGGNCACNEPKD